MTETRDDPTLTREWLDDLVGRMDGLQPLFDRARVKAALGRAEVRDLIQRAGTDIEEVRGDLRRLREEVRQPSGEIVRNMRLLLDDVSHTLERIVDRA